LEKYGRDFLVVFAHVEADSDAIYGRPNATEGASLQMLADELPTAVSWLNDHSK
jgi:hypothetical protein